MVHGALRWLDTHLATRSPVEKPEPDLCDQMISSLMSLLDDLPCSSADCETSATHTARTVATCIFGTVFAGRVDDKTLDILTAVMSNYEDGSRVVQKESIPHRAEQDEELSSSRHTRHKAPSLGGNISDDDDDDDELETEIASDGLRVLCDMPMSLHSNLQLQATQAELRECKLQQQAMELQISRLVKQRNDLMFELDSYTAAVDDVYNSAMLLESSSSEVTKKLSENIEDSNGGEVQSTVPPNIPCRVQMQGNETAIVKCSKAHLEDQLVRAQAELDVLQWPVNTKTAFIKSTTLSSPIYSPNSIRKEIMKSLLSEGLAAEAI